MSATRPSLLSLMVLSLFGSAAACASGSASTGTGGTSSSGPSSTSTTTTTGTGGMSVTTGTGGTTVTTGTGGAGGATTGTGGMGGATSSSSTGGAGGTTGDAGACAQPSDCPPTGSECAAATCTSGMCGVSFTAAGTPTSTQTAGDCRENQCDGMGNVTSAADDTDLPVDGNACTGDVCTNGVPSNPPLAAGAPCAAMGGTVCNGTGTCVVCNVATDCPGQDTTCQQRTCTANACGMAYAPSGTKLAMQTPGDCHDSVCDGAGNVTTVVDNADVPVDNNPCTSDVCTNGVPSNPPVAAGSPCGSGSTVCNATGMCVGCATSSDCPPTGNACLTPTCTAGACTTTPVAQGTPAPTQTPGDCQTSVCDGMGNVTNVVNNADVPVDGNPCTSDVCTNGVPSNPPLPARTACSQNGGTFCDGNGACVQCLAVADCPANGSACVDVACTAGACGTTDVAQGTPTSTQTPGDCKTNVCDGMGNVTSVVDDTDVPVDGNPCTADVCTNGVPSNPQAAAGTACNHNGGTACDAAGACSVLFEVVRVGDGSAALSSAATAVFLEERFATDGTLVPAGNNPLALPTTASGAGARLLTSGTATSEGALARSADGHYVTLAGYDAAPGTASVGTTTSATVNRIVGRVDAAGNVDTSTRINALISGSSVRSAVTGDGTAFWVSGATNGIVYIQDTTTGGMSILASPANTRVVDIFGGQLYGTSGSGAFTNVFTIGAGLPITAATATSLPGLPTSGASPYSFALVGTSVLYVADDRSPASGGGVQKWTLSGGTWTLTTTFTNGITAGTRGVAAVVTGSTTTVIATVAVTNANPIVTFVDDGMNLNPAATVIATAATNTVYRGAALAPQ